MSLKNLVKKAKAIEEVKHKGVTEKEIEGSFNDIEYNINIFTPTREEIIETLESLLEKLKSHKDLPEETVKELVMTAFKIAFSQDARATGVFHPSSYSIEDKHCLRKMYYEYGRVKKDATFIPIASDNRMQRLFDLGTMVHLYIQYNLKEAGVLLDFESTIDEPEFGVRGKADGRVDFCGFDFYGNFHHQKERILEIKTMLSFGFNVLKAPKQYHINQASIYGHFLGLDEIVFVYYNKDNSELKIFVEKVDHEYAEGFKGNASEVISRYNTNSRKVRSKKVEKHTNIFDRVCSSRASKKALDCPYADFCFKS